MRPPELAGIGAREWRFVGGAVLTTALVTSIPYLFGHLSAPPDRVFMGIVWNVPDNAQYLSWMRESAHGLLIQNRLTAEAGAPVYFNLLWWVLGRLVALGLPLEPALQGFRLVAIALFLGATYLGCAWALDDRRARRVAFFTIAFGGGLGWLLVVHKYATGRAEVIFPLDLYVVEPNAFFAALTTPHQIFSAALIVGIFLLAYNATELGCRRRALLAGVLALGLGLFHAYDLITVYGVLFAFALLRSLRWGFAWRWWWPALAVFALSCLPPAYFVRLTATDPIWRQVLAQYGLAGVFTPDPFHLVVLMGLPLVGAVLAFNGLFTDEDHRRLFLKTWFLVGLLLIYLPTDYQIKLLNGWQIPAVLLGTAALFERALPWLATRSRGAWPLVGRLLQGRAALALLALAVLPTNTYLLAWRMVDLSRHQAPFYLRLDERESLRWLDQHTAPSDVVLSELTLGQYVPALAGARAFVAHWAQSVEYPAKQQAVARFFQADTPDQERQTLLARYGVRFVLYSAHERALGSFDPATASYLQPVFTSDDVRVYQVVGQQTAHRAGEGQDAAK